MLFLYLARWSAEKQVNYKTWILYWKLWFLYILRLLLLPWSQTTQRRMHEEKSLKISPQKKKESANLRSIQIREWLLNVNKKETCYESGKKPAQNRADLFLSTVPAWMPWAQRVPTSHVSPPLEQPVPRLISAVPPPAWVSEVWRSARAAVKSLMLWASCSLADTLFTWWGKSTKTSLEN